MFKETTGSTQVLVRDGYADCDTFGFGFWKAATGNLDAPAHIPQGSVRLHNTLVQSPALSHAHRDWDGYLPLGASHDGPEPATLWLPA
jgi:hypothetical protein